LFRRPVNSRGAVAGLLGSMGPSAEKPGSNAPTRGIARTWPAGS